MGEKIQKFEDFEMNEASSFHALKPSALNSFVAEAAAKGVEKSLNSVLKGTKHKLKPGSIKVSTNQVKLTVESPDGDIKYVINVTQNK